MAERIEEKQYKVNNAPEVKTEGAAFGRASQLAEKLSTLVSNLGDFGVGVSKEYLKGQEKKTSEELANEFSENPTGFFKQYNTGEEGEMEIPQGWTKMECL